MIRMRDIWTFQQLMSYSTWTIYALVIMHVFGLWGWAFPDGNDPTCSSGDVAIKATATVYVTNNATATAAINDVMANVEKHAMAYTNKNTTFCGLVQLLSTASSSLSTLAAFIIGGFIYSTRVLWLARRTAYCNLCGAIKKLLMNVATIIPERDRKVLSRWAILGFELSVLEGRMLIDTDEARHFLETSGLIIEDEWESMVNGNRHTTVWVGALTMCITPYSGS